MHVNVCTPSFTYPVVLLDRWGATDDLATSSLHSSRLSAFLVAALSVMPSIPGCCHPISFSVCLFFALLALCPAGLSWQALKSLLDKCFVSSVNIALGQLSVCICLSPLCRFTERVSSHSKHCRFLITSTGDSVCCYLISCRISVCVFKCLLLYFMSIMHPFLEPNNSRCWGAVSLWLERLTLNPEYQG